MNNPWLSVDEDIELEAAIAISKVDSHFPRLITANKILNHILHKNKVIPKAIKVNVIYVEDETDNTITLKYTTQDHKTNEMQLSKRTRQWDDIKPYLTQEDNFVKDVATATFYEEALNIED